ncbi:MAG: hypothetical protein H7831_15515 [Magnetococcus sp. WYHC-3]
MSEFEIAKSNGVKFEPTGLSLTRKMDIEEAQRFVNSLDAMESGVSYWTGDFLLAMEALHGENAAQLVPPEKAQSWNVYRWVCSRVKPETRRPKLSFSHHIVVASLLTERQQIFLEKAEQEQLSVSALKKLVAKDKGKKEKPPKMIECPSCHVSFELPK